MTEIHSARDEVQIEHLESDISECYTKVYFPRERTHGNVKAWFDDLEVQNWRRSWKARQSVLERQCATYDWDLQHFIVALGEDEPVVTQRFLGHGSLGIVEEVRRSDMKLPTFVRKRVQLPARKREAKATLEIIQEEARNLKALVHPHIVALIGTYEEKKHSNVHFYFLLMSPMGETDLKRFLDIVGDEDSMSQDALNWKKWIGKWFTCLASALAYMHEQGIRHQDIKPSNIIHKGTTSTLPTSARPPPSKLRELHLPRVRRVHHTCTPHLRSRPN